MVVFGLVGYGLIKAAVNYDPHKAIGLDGALSKLSHLSYGPLLLGVVAAGLIGFALYSIADARYPQDLTFIVGLLIGTMLLAEWSWRATLPEPRTQRGTTGRY